jgi:hypothetical protein
MSGFDVLVEVPLMSPPATVAMVLGAWSSPHFDRTVLS